MAGDPVRALQDAKRRGPGRHEASVDHFRARPGRPAVLLQMRQSRPTPRSDFATIGLAATSISDRKSEECNLYSITTNQAAKRLLKMEPEGATTNIDNAR
jgi:hypothetical protein